MKFSIKMFLIVLAVIVALLVMFVFAFNSVPNTAVAFEEQIKTAQSDIKVQEKRRADLIPNLVDCVKEYDKHEYETLMGVIEARGTNSDSSVNEIQTMINAVAENYPELKSSDNYKELMNELSVTENLIAKYRSSYNKEIKNYNQYIKQFPNKQILNMFGHQPIDYDYLTYDVSEDAPTNLFGD
ncbi:MAG: LemA family protein [Bacteroidales bacterium]|nr:LemA family protein [Bacteroidales bacterium]